MEANANRTVLVAGGTGALGRPVASAIAQLGFQTVTLSRRVRAVANRGPVEHISCDVTDATAVKRCVSKISRRYPPLWALVNCAGCNVIRKYDRYSLLELRRILDVNLYGTMLLARFTIPLLKRAHGGRIINVASQAGLDPQIYNTVYSAAESGIIAFGKGLARELAPFGISVISVCPGDIDSPMMNRAVRGLSKVNGISPKAARQQLYQKIPVGRFGTPREIAEVVSQLLRIETLFLTGAALVIAGGRTCH